MGGTIPTEQPAYNLAELHDMFFFSNKNWWVTGLIDYDEALLETL